MSAQSNHTAGGVSSFGYSGTIVHAVLRATTHSASRRIASAALFRRRRFRWLESKHPLLQQRLAASAGTVFQSRAAGELIKLLADHVVKSRVICPAAAYLEMAHAASVVAAGRGGGAVLAQSFFMREEKRVEYVHRRLEQRAEEVSK